VNVELLKKHAEAQGVPIVLLDRILREEEDRVHLRMRRNCVALLQELVEEARMSRGFTAIPKRAEE